MTTFDVGYRLYLQPEVHPSQSVTITENSADLNIETDNMTAESLFLRELSFKLWLSGYQPALVPEQSESCDLIRKLHYLSGFVSVHPDWLSVYAEVMQIVQAQQRTVKIPNGVIRVQIAELLNNAGLSFSTNDNNEVVLNPFVDIHDDLLATLAEMKHQIDNLGDFSSKLQDKLILLLDKTSDPRRTYKSTLQNFIHSINQN